MDESDAEAADEDMLTVERSAIVGLEAGNKDRPELALAMTLLL